VKGNSALAGMFHIEINGRFEQDVLDIAFAIAGSMWLVHELGNVGSGTLGMKLYSFAE
jgi:hypothetical protein